MSDLPCNITFTLQVMKNRKQILGDISTVVSYHVTQQTIFLYMLIAVQKIDDSCLGLKK